MVILPETSKGTMESSWIRFVVVIGVAVANRRNWATQREDRHTNREQRNQGESSSAMPGPCRWFVLHHVVSLSPVVCRLGSGGPFLLSRGLGVHAGTDRSGSKRTYAKRGQTAHGICCFFSFGCGNVKLGKLLRLGGRFWYDRVFGAER